MNGHQNDERFDCAFYKERVSHFLPDRVLDFHTHVWTRGQWLGAGDEKSVNSDSFGDFEAAKYMVTDTQYTMETLKDDLARIFPDKESHAVCFGQPTPAVDIDRTNEYVIENVVDGDYPLLVCGGGCVSTDKIYQHVTEGGFYGYKVFLNWVGNDYGDVTVEDMLLPDEMDIANELGLVVLLHVPRSLRLADPKIGAGVRKLALKYPKAKIVLAHCGRCYDPYLMRQAISSVADLHNVYMDTSMVMDPVSIAMALREMGSARMLFATDLPVAAMYGKRVNVKDHWVDLVSGDYAHSDFRVQSDGIRASYMAHEIAVAIELGADLAGLSESEMKSIFFENGMALLKSVKK